MNSGLQKSRDAGHTISLRTRNSMQISGVLEVISFDDSTVVLETSEGEMTVDGNGLRMDTLDLDGGNVLLTGEVCGINYGEGIRRKKRRLFGRVE